MDMDTYDSVGVGGPGCQCNSALDCCTIKRGEVATELYQAQCDDRVKGDCPAQLEEENSASIDQDYRLQIKS